MPTETEQHLVRTIEALQTQLTHVCDERNQQEQKNLVLVSQIADLLLTLAERDRMIITLQRDLDDVLDH